MVIRAELQIVVVVIFRQAEGEEAGPRVFEEEGFRIDGLGVTDQIGRRLHVPLVAAALAAGDEELAGEQFLDQSAPVGGARGAVAHGSEVGDGDWEGVAVEAEDDPAERLRLGAAGEVGLAEGAAEEVGGADAEIEEHSVGDGGVGLGGGGGGGGGGEGGEEGEGGGEEEEGAAVQGEAAGVVAVVVGRWDGVWGETESGGAAHGERCCMAGGNGGGGGNRVVYFDATQSRLIVGSKLVNFQFLFIYLLGYYILNVGPHGSIFFWNWILERAIEAHLSCNLYSLQNFSPIKKILSPSMIY